MEPEKIQSESDIFEKNLGYRLRPIRHTGTNARTFMRSGKEGESAKMGLFPPIRTGDTGRFGFGDE